ALGQLLLQSANWLLVSRGQSERLLKVLLATCPVILISFLVGLPFGAKGVAFSGSVVLLGILPPLLKVTFRGTPLTLQKLAQAIVWPIAVSVAGVLLADVAELLLAPNNIRSELLDVTLGFAVICSLSLLLPRVRSQVLLFKNVLAFGSPS